MLKEAIQAISRALQSKEFDLPRIAFEDLYHLFATASLITGRRGISWVCIMYKLLFRCLRFEVNVMVQSIIAQFLIQLNSGMN